MLKNTLLIEHGTQLSIRKLFRFQYLSISGTQSCLDIFGASGRVR